MGFSLHARAVFGGVLFVTVAACNVMLDNNPGILEESSVDETAPARADRAPEGGKPPPQGSATASAEPGHDASNDVSPPPPEAAPPAPACAAGWADCNANASDGCESDLVASIASCGACGVVCPADGAPHTLPTCANGACVRVCDPGRGDCNGKPTDGCEADLTHDKRNCGACGTYCLFSKCVEGRCVF